MKKFKLLDQSDTDNDNDNESSEEKTPITNRIAKLFLPDSKVRIIFDIFIFLVIWYNSVITPIRIFIMSGDSTNE